MSLQIQKFARTLKRATCCARRGMARVKFLHLYLCYCASVLTLPCVCPYVAVRVKNKIYGDFEYVDGGVRCTVTQLRDGDNVSDEEEDVLTLVCLCPYACVLVFLCLHMCVLIIHCMCPYADVHVSLCLHVCVLMNKNTKNKKGNKKTKKNKKVICPYTCMLVSSCLSACVLMPSCVYPYWCLLIACVLVLLMLVSS